jgi:perosamine synthetase
MIEMAAVEFDAEAERLVLEVLRSGRLAQGPMVERFENEFARLVGTRHAVAVSSGSAALALALKGAGIGPGDEVVTSPLTFVATLNAIIQVGATARFADIDATDFTIDPAAVVAAITPRTSAILPVHLYGQPAAMAELTDVAERHGLALVEDAAQAHGASGDGRAAGSFGVGCFSFYATKNMTTGEGGMVTTDDPEVVDRVRLLRNQGMRDRYCYEAVGYNLRMTEISAALGLSELARLGERTRRRLRNARRLSEGLAGIRGLSLPTVAAGRSHVYHLYTTRVTTAAARSRDEVMAALHSRGVAAGVYYPRAVYDYACYQDHPLVAHERMPEAELAATQVLSLPVHPGLTADDTEHVITAVRGAFDG